MMKNFDFSEAKILNGGFRSLFAFLHGVFFRCFNGIYVRLKTAFLEEISRD
jgi:hypothetical protein